MTIVQIFFSDIALATIAFCFAAVNMLAGARSGNVGGMLVGHVIAMCLMAIGSPAAMISGIVWIVRQFAH